MQPVAEAERWDAVLPAAIADRLKVDGRYVAVPADLHRGNRTFANTRLLQAAGVEAASGPRTDCGKLEAGADRSVT